MFLKCSCMHAKVLKLKFLKTAQSKLDRGSSLFLFSNNLKKVSKK